MNTPLEGLHEIVLPPLVSWLPQTIGWYVALALLLGLAVWLGRRLWRRRLADRYRGLALARLDELEVLLGTENRGAALGELPELVKRTALQAWPRRQVASLVGDDWLRFLDRSYGGSGFSEGPGRLLPKLAYDPPGEAGRLGDHEIRELTTLVRLWIRRHRRRPELPAEEGAA